MISRFSGNTDNDSTVDIKIAVELKHSVNFGRTLEMIRVKDQGKRARIILREKGRYYENSLV